jgi:hypothetical protein
MASEQEEGSSQRSTSSRRARAEFILVFRNRFPRESVDLEENYEDFFSLVPEELATHNRLGGEGQFWQVRVLIFYDL